MDLFDAFDLMGDMLAGIGLIGYIGLIVAMIAPYIISGYMIMCIGRKSGLSDDWMPFLPISRQLYQMKIADCPGWYVLFFQGCFVNTAVMFGLGLISGMLFKNGLISVLIAAAYYIATLVFTFSYYKEYYPRFGFNPNTAWIEIIWAFGVVKLVLLVLVAFSDSIYYHIPGELGVVGGMPPVPDNDPNTLPIPPLSPVNKKKAMITGILGKYADASFDISDGSSVVFGRSATDANIIFDQFDTDISRKHCSVKYDSRSDQYIVTDFSTNGTYLEDGSKLTPNQSIAVMRGTTVYLGKNKKNSFRLG